MFGHDFQEAIGVIRDPVPIAVVSAWVIASVVAAGAVFVMSRRRYLDLDVAVSLLVLGCVVGCLLWSSQAALITRLGS